MSAYLELRLKYLSIDQTYYQYQQDMVPELFWRGARRVLKDALMGPFNRAVILDQSSLIVSVVRELITEIDGEYEK
jgi:hypothetical protein